MAEETNGSVFNEVVELNIDLEKFKSQMSEVERIYSASLEKFKGPEISGDRAVITALNEIKTAYERTSANASKYIQDLTDVMLETAAQVEKALNKIGSVTKDSSAAADEAVNNKLTTEERWNLRRSALEQKAYEEEVSQYEKGKVAFEKYTADKEKVEQQWQARLAKLRSDEAAREAAQLRKSEQAYEQYLALQQKYAKQIPEGQLPTNFFSQNASPEVMAKQVESLGGSLKKTRTIWEEFSGSMFRNLGGLIANVVRFKIAWELVGGVINTVFDSFVKFILYPINAVKQGAEYLGKLEEQASQLKAALLSAEQFSDDPAKNLRLAADEAERLTKRIQDLAAQLQLNSAAIQTGFQKFLEFGGRTLTKSNDQALQVTALAIAGLQAQQPQFQQRVVGTELSRLVTGTLKDANKLPQAFGLSADALNRMAKEARTNKDLLAQIIAAAPGLVDRLRTADQRMKALADASALAKQRFEGLVAGPALKTYEEFLKKFLEFLNKNADAIESIGRAFGYLVNSAVGGFFRIISTNSDRTLGFFKLLALGAIGVGNGLAKASEGLRALITIAQAAQTALKSIDLSHPFSSSKKALEQLSAATKKAIDDGKKAGEELDKQAAIRVADIYGVRVDQSKEIPNTPTHGILGAATGNKSAAQQIRDDYAEQLAAVREGTQEELDAVDRAEHLREISLNTAVERRKAIYQRELKDIVELGKAILQEAQTLGLKPQQVDHLQSLITRTEEATRKAVSHQSQAQDDKVIADRLQREEEAANANLRLFTSNEQAKLELKRTYAQEGLITDDALAKDELTTQQRIFDEEERVLNKKIQDAGQDLSLVQRLTEQKRQLEQDYANFVIQQEERIRQAKQKALEDELALLARRRQAEIDQLQFRLQNEDLNPTARQQLQVQVLQKQSENAKFNVDDAQKALDALEQAASRASITERGQYIPAIEAAKQKLDELKQAAENAAKVLNKEKPGVAKGAREASKEVFGFDISEAWKNAQTSGQKVAVVFNAIAGAAQSLPGIFSQIQQGVQQGGVLGGIGAGLGVVSGIASAINPVVGAIVGGIGAAFSAIGGLFKAAARRIAKEIKQEIQQIENQYSLGQITLNEAIKKLQQERQDAINRLSGKKGGKDELNKILPDLDNEIAQLQKQQKDIKDTFEQSLAVLKSGGSDALQSWINDWVQINKQVKEYLDAVGAAGNKNAQDFLNLTLAQKRKDLQNELNDDELQAINDAIQLNDLLQQRNQLEQDYANQKFAILSADSVERRQTNAITAGQQLAKLKAEHDQRAAQLDFEIKQATQKVDIERQVFNIARDTATLQQESLAIQLDQLNQQKQTWLDIQKILRDTANLVAGPNGSFPGVQNVPGVNPIPGFGAANITIINNGPIDQGTAKKFAYDLYQELMLRYRGGFGRSLYAY